MSVPIVLAFAGTALMAVAIFVPFRSHAAADDDEAVEVVAEGPQWPELVEPSATGCDVIARLDLVDALASIGSPWAIGVLYRAREDENDPAVQAAIRLALERIAVPAPAG